jgi:hypothetical protein
MSVRLFNDCLGNFKGIHFLPSLSLYKTTYMAELSFSWIIWTVEWRLWDEETLEK